MPRVWSGLETWVWKARLLDKLGHETDDLLDFAIKEVTISAASPLASVD